MTPNLHLHRPTPLMEDTVPHDVCMHDEHKINNNYYYCSFFLRFLFVCVFVCLFVTDYQFAICGTAAHEGGKSPSGRTGSLKTCPETEQIRKSK